MNKSEQRQMRRKNRELDATTAEEILQNGKYGALGTTSPDGSPYTVPISYVYEEGAIYFHAFNAAEEGLSHKLDNIRQNNKVCFTVVDICKSSDIDFSTAYSSVIAFGKAEPVEDGELRFKALMSLARKYQPHLIDNAPDYIKSAGDKVCIVKINIDHITGKGNV